MRENGQIGCNGHNVQPLVAPEPEIEPEVTLLVYLALEVTLIQKAVKVLILKGDPFITFAPRGEGGLKK